MELDVAADEVDADVPAEVVVAVVVCGCTPVFGDTVAIVVVAGDTLVAATGATEVTDVEPELGAKLLAGSVDKVFTEPCCGKESPLPQPMASSNVADQVVTYKFTARWRNTGARRGERNPGVCAGLLIGPEG